jgi:tetratricopeptide (TPR) repeat protein
MTNVFRLMARFAGAMLVMAIVVGSPLPCGAQVTPGSRVLIMPFSVEVEANAPGGAGAALWMGEAASILLAERLSLLGVGALTRDQRAAAFDRLNLPMSAALTRATTIRVAEIIGASEVIFGEVRVGDQLRVRARLIRISAGLEMPEAVERGSIPDIFALFGRVAASLATHTGRLRPASAASPAVMPVEAFEDYVKGLVAATPAAQQRFLERALRLAPADPRVLMALWSVYSAQGLHERALAAANAVPAQAAAARQAHFAVGLSLIELKRYDGAFQALSDLYSRSRSAAVSNALGVVQLRRAPGSGGNLPAFYFKRAVDEDAEDTDYVFNLGYALARAKSFPEALTWLRETVRLDAADGEAHAVMSAVLLETGRSAEAQRELDLARLLGTERTLELQTLTATIADGLERLPSDPELDVGPRLNAAIANPAQRDQRETAAFHLGNGKTLIASHRDREAAEELRRAIYLSPYDYEPHILLGQVYHRIGQLPQAIDELKVANWCRETAAGRLALATALLDANDVVAARVEIRRALVLAPGSTEAEELLRRAGE